MTSIEASGNFVCFYAAKAIDNEDVYGRLLPRGNHLWACPRRADSIYIEARCPIDRGINANRQINNVRYYPRFL